MAQCNIVTCCCMVCALLTFISSAVTYFFVVNLDLDQARFNINTQFDTDFNATQEFTVFFSEFPASLLPDDPNFEVYYQKSDDVECEEAANKMKVTWQCELCNTTEPVKDLIIKCEERVNTVTSGTLMKVLVWAPYLAEDPTDGLKAGTYTVRAEVPVSVHTNFINGENILSVLGVYAAAVGGLCGGVCLCIGMAAYVCTASPVTQPQPQGAAMQMQAQPLQQPMAPAYGQYGQQPVNPAYGQYGQQPPAQAQYGQYGAQP